MDYSHKNCQILMGKLNPAAYFRIIIMQKNSQYVSREKVPYHPQKKWSHFLKFYMHSWQMIFKTGIGHRYIYIPYIQTQIYVCILIFNLTIYVYI